MEQSIDLSAYGSGQLTLVVRKPSDKDIYYLIWASVELINVEVPSWPSPFYETRSFNGNPSQRMFICHCAVEPRTAYHWFDTLARTGNVTLPKPLTCDLEDAGHSVQAGPYLAEPPWPGFTILANDRRFGFVPAGMCAPAICSLWQDEQAVDCAWSDSQQAKVYEWIRGLLGLDLAADSRLIGSAHFIAANPYFRELSLRLAEPEDDGSLIITVQTVLRANKEFDDFRLLLIEQRDKGWRLLYSGALSSSLQLIRAPNRQLGKVAALVTRANELIYISEPHYFIRNIEMSFNVMGKTRRISIVRNGAEETETFSVKTTQRREISRIGSGCSRDGLEITRDIRRRMQRREVEASLNQVWFYGDLGRARSKLRSILERAHSRVLFVDPYFGPNELVRFAPAVSDIAAEIQVLSSMDWTRATSESQDSPLDKLKLLMNTRKRLESELEMQDISIKIMQGSPAEIHDRFLAIDEHVWMLGSSLNAFGKRGTMLVRLYEPRSVIDVLEEVWASAGTKFLEQRIHLLEERPEEDDHSGQERENGSCPDD